MSQTKTWKHFEENELTHSAAHYLLTIHELLDARGYARVTDVARELSITTGSASTTLKSLRGRGLVTEDDNRFLTLSGEGNELARSVLERRALVQDFLARVLGVSKAQAEVDACKIEHLLSVETAGKLQKFLKRSR